MSGIEMIPAEEIRNFFGYVVVLGIFQTFLLLVLLVIAVTCAKD